MESLKDFGEVIITIQACVIKKFLQGFMAPKQKKKKKPVGEESSKAEEVDEEKKLAEEARVRHQSHRWSVASLTVGAPALVLNQICVWSCQVATAVEKWKSAIKEAQTFSRMHVLLGMLDACIKWDMSAENARCKVCRKKGKSRQQPRFPSFHSETFRKVLSQHVSGKLSLPGSCLSAAGGVLDC